MTSGEVGGRDEGMVKWWSGAAGEGERQWRRSTTSHEQVIKYSSCEKSQNASRSIQRRPGSPPSAVEHDNWQGNRAVGGNAKEETSCHDVKTPRWDKGVQARARDRVNHTHIRNITPEHLRVADKARVTAGDPFP